ncbi:Transposase family protein (plasmid) [Shigella dysenteriae WRSd5]|nr:Transposase family protein [Shigella dysenteriae WRSd5]
MSERELDARLYGSASTVPVVLTESTVMPEVPGGKKRPRREPPRVSWRVFYL